MDDARLLVVTGPPGSGKSTVAGLLVDRTADGHPSGPTALVAGDHFFDFLAAGFIEPWEPASANQNAVVVDASAAATGRFVAAGWPTVFDGVIGPWFLDRFLGAAGVGEVDYAVLLPPVEHCVERVSTRVGHGFTDETATRKMHHEFSRAEIGAPHRFDNGSEAPEATVERILAARRAGHLRYRS